MPPLKPVVELARVNSMSANTKVKTGQVLKVLHRTLANDGDDWKEESIDITEYRGHTIYVYFNVYNDMNDKLTWAFIDDVEVSACFPPATETPISR